MTMQRAIKRYSMSPVWCINDCHTEICLLNCSNFIHNFRDDKVLLLQVKITTTTKVIIISIIKNFVCIS